MRKSLPQQHVTSRLNDVLHEIHKDISADLPAARLAAIAAFSEHHFHRVFAKYMGESVHRYIARIRLEQAANQLMFDQSATVSEVALACGFKSLSSFSRAFKLQMGSSPGEWRSRSHTDAQLQTEFLQVPEIARGYQNIANRALPQPVICEVPARLMAYIRHHGYDRSIAHTWQKLDLWRFENGLHTQGQFALLHSNPCLVPLKDCRYVACVEIHKTPLQRSVINVLRLPGGIHARFHLAGVYGEFIPYLSRILQEWVPHSGLRVRTTPIWVAYNTNQFTDSQHEFDLELYIPIGS
ncbi:AraC family transcriptional regulator [Teredinibacter turnerae]|uniref:AraC family transcriptional regulator n=1 Tax=Teredinibacter turnerae TaxID=2426 RepID=UPI000475C5A7|nr:AraC family transcriptional regulator [Teredinibacter turnerae]